METVGVVDSMVALGVLVFVVVLLVLNSAVTSFEISVVVSYSVVVIVTEKGMDI